MPYERFLMQCDRSLENNGTLNLTFIKRADYSLQHSQEEIIHGDLMNARGPYKAGESYWVTIEPAKPREL